MFEHGVSYTRKDIHDQIGGSLQSFLPHVGGRVVAACLRPDYNPDAPDILLVGTGDGIEHAADMLVAQRNPVPTFLKLSTGGWKYVGEHAVVRSSQDAADLAVQARRSGRDDITRVIYMVPSPHMDRDQFAVHFNNCQNREHERLFGRGAFYDLNVTGVQAMQAVGLQAGQDCVVATTAPDNRVIFTWYSFFRERLLCEHGNDSDSTRYRVFFGDPLLAETFSKEDAAAHPRYSAFFNVKGHFKQQSTILASIPHGQRPTGPPTDSPAVRNLRRELHKLQQPSRPKTPATLKRVRRILKSYERASAITRYVRRTRGSGCQLREDPGFVMRNGHRYCEAHHLFHLSKNPPPECLGPEYLVVLCATCHRRIHYANVGEPVREAGGWQVRVDDEETLFRV